MHISTGGDISDVLRKTIKICISVTCHTMSGLLALTTARGKDLSPCEVEPRAKANGVGAILRAIRSLDAEIPSARKRPVEIILTNS